MCVAVKLPLCVSIYMYLSPIYLKNRKINFYGQWETKQIRKTKGAKSVILCSLLKFNMYYLKYRAILLMSMNTKLVKVSH